MSQRDFSIDLSKPVTLEFQGGPADGFALRSDSEDPQECEAARGYLLLTGDGTVGKGFKGVPPGPAQEFFHDYFRRAKRNADGTWTTDGSTPPHAHTYRVSARVDEGSRTRITLAYQGVDG